MITLPIIHTLSSSITISERRHIKKTLSGGEKRRDLIKLTNIVSDYGGFDYAQLKLKEISDDAIAALDIFPDSKYKRSMIDLCLYNIKRAN